jgi:hypothetical protein
VYYVAALNYPNPCPRLRRVRGGDGRTTDMTPEKILQQILSGKKNIKFTDFIKLVKAFGFVLDRTRGSHHIFKKDGVVELINVQNYKGEAKLYQIKQFLEIVERYGLSLGEEK